MSGQSIERRGGGDRPRVYPTRIGESSFWNKEKISLSQVEIRIADPELDAEAIASIFRQHHVIEHLSGVAPTERTSEVNVKRYAEKYPELSILIANGIGIEDLLKKSRNLKTIVVVDKASGEISATASVGRPTDPGITYGAVSRVATNEKFRYKGHGTIVLRSANALLLGPKELGGYGQFGAQAGIIVGIEGFSIPLSMFMKEGYSVRNNPPSANCVSWDNKARKFVPRETQLVQLDAQKYLSLHTVSEIRRYIPQEIPKAS